MILGLAGPMSYEQIRIAQRLLSALIHGSCGSLLMDAVNHEPMPREYSIPGLCGTNTSYDFHKVGRQ